MRFRTRLIPHSAPWLVVPLIAGIPLGAYAQLEEVVVTATRRETSLQDTPISIQAFTGAELELGGIQNGRDLGIMVPNVVLNAGVGEFTGDFYVRGLPGVGIYLDGVWQGSFGFMGSNLIEMERVEVLRGPQGTLFGRNTNGGAVQMVSRRPGDEFGARINLDVGDFNRRDATIAVDLPITDSLKTKFMGATLQNDGFLEGVTTPWNFGSQDDTLMRADILFEPTDRFSLRFTINDEEKHGTDPRIHEMTRWDNGKIYAYNIMLGAFQSQADAACVANPTFTGGPGSLFNNSCGPNGWPAPPSPPPGTAAVGTRFTGQAPSAFNPTTHTTDFPGGTVSGFDFAPGELGKWQTKSDSAENGQQADTQYVTATVDWDITDNLNFEAILSDWEQDQRNVIDFDGTEFIITTDDRISLQENQTLELHLSGSTPNGRVNWIAGYYSLDENFKQRFYRWAMWEFTIPNTGPTDPTLNLDYLEYVRDTAYLLGLNGENTPPGSSVYSGGSLLTPATCLGGQPTVHGAFGPCSRSPWDLYFITVDNLTRTHDEDQAFFGEATFSVTDKLDLTVGARRSDKTGWQSTLVPTDAFRTLDPDIRPQGDVYAFSSENRTIDPDQPKIDTYKFAVQYQFTDDFMMYASYSEGFTQAERDISQVGDAGLTPPDCVRIDSDEVYCDLEPEVIETIELGLRSDWLDGRLRFNATYFDSDWVNMRIVQLPFDAAGNTQPFPYDSDKGAGTADGFEFEVVYVPTDRLRLNVGLGLINTNYIQAGLYDGLTGNYPGAPFAYAPDNSASLGINYDIPLGNGGHIMLVGNYGWMDDYARDAAIQRTKIDEQGRPIQEPGYGIVNARLVYEPADRNYSVELWGRNLTDELYLNGGFDTHDTWGYDFSTIGRSREVGVSLGFTF